MSSTIFAVYGSSSLTHMPHWPCCSNLYFDGAIGNRAWPEVIVVSRWPMRIAVGQVLVVPLLHHRLVVEQVHLRRAADHVQVDDVLGLGREVGRHRRRRALVGRDPGRPRGVCRHLPSAASDGSSPRTFEPAARNVGASCLAGIRRRHSWNLRPARPASALLSCFYLFSTSSRFMSWLQSIVQAASCGRVERSGRLLTRRRRGAVPRLVGVVPVDTSSAQRTTCAGSRVPPAGSRRASSRRPMTCEAGFESRRRALASACSARWRAASTNCGSFSVDQRLQRRVGPLAADGAGLAAGGVEDLHRGRRAPAASRTCRGCGDRGSRRCPRL